MALSGQTAENAAAIVFILAGVAFISFGAYAIGVWVIRGRRSIPGKLLVAEGLAAVLVVVAFVAGVVVP